MSFSMTDFRGLAVHSRPQFARPLEGEQQVHTKRNFTSSQFLSSSTSDHFFVSFVTYVRVMRPTYTPLIVKMLFLFKTSIDSTGTIVFPPRKSSSALKRLLDVKRNLALKCCSCVKSGTQVGNFGSALPDFWY